MRVWSGAFEVRNDRNVSRLSRGDAVRERMMRGQGMSKHDKILLQVLHGTSDANIRFEDLRQLLLHLGFEERIRGGHHIFRKQGVEQRLNLQREGNKAKIYQVRQVRAAILKHGLRTWT